MALRLHAISSLVEEPRRLTILELAGKIGSPAMHLVSHQTSTRTHPCDACSRQACTLWSIHRKLYRNNKHIISEEATEILTKLAKKRCTDNPACRGNTPLAQHLTKRVTSFTIQESRARVCYSCAIPVIVEARRKLFHENAPDSEITQNDIQALAQNRPSALLPADLSQQPTTRPWKFSSLIGSTVMTQEGVTGYVLTTAPKKMITTTPCPPKKPSNVILSSTLNYQSHTEPQAFPPQPH